MADVTPNKSGHMHFSSTGAGAVPFQRLITHLYVTASGGSTTISFDGGNNFMALADGTHVFPYPNVKTVHFGAGTWSGCGVST